MRCDVFSASWRRRFTSEIMQTFDVAGAAAGDECRKAKTCTGVVHEIEADAAIRNFIRPI